MADVAGLAATAQSTRQRIKDITDSSIAWGRQLFRGSADQPSERIAGPLHPLWALDHAGLVATLDQPPGGARD
jgi:hypothetical protein